MSLMSHHHHHPHKSHHHNGHNSLAVIHEQPVPSTSQNTKSKSKKKKRTNNGAFLEIDPHWDEKKSLNGKWENKFFASCDKSSDCSDAFFYPCIMNYLFGSALGTYYNLKLKLKLKLFLIIFCNEGKNCVCGVLACCCPISIAYYRGKIRQAKNIEVNFNFL